MTTVYWLCLGGGLAATLVLVFVGDVLEGLLDAAGGPADPYTLVGGLTAMGGAGLLLETYTGLGTVPAALVAAALGLVAAVALEALYVRPMRRSENSTAFSVREYVGRTGELSTALTATGHGEVVVRMGASTTFQTARSFAGEALPRGARVVVVEVTPDHVLLVAPLTDDEAGLPEAAPASRLSTWA